MKPLGPPGSPSHAIVNYAAEHTVPLTTAIMWWLDAHCAPRQHAEEAEAPGKAERLLRAYRLAILKAADRSDALRTAEQQSGLERLEDDSKNLLLRYIADADWSELLGCGEEIRLIDGEPAVVGYEAYTLSELLRNVAGSYFEIGIQRRVIEQLSRYFARRATEESKPPKPPKEAEACTHPRGYTGNIECWCCPDCGLRKDPPGPEPPKDAEAERLVRDLIGELRAVGKAWATSGAPIADLVNRAADALEAQP